MTKYSIDTALRDIKDLISKGMLQNFVNSGCITRYNLTLS